MRTTTPHPGALVISLDFELYWGSRDHRPLADCRRNLLGTREVVPRLLELFRRHEIHATWATVGLLFCDGKEEALRLAPQLRPSYADPNLSPYQHLEGLRDEDAPYHFAPHLVRMIADTPHQELATHTFSHFYCLEPGQTAEQFRADLLAAQRIAREKLQRELTSIVFPRNQVAYVDVCRELGIRTYRGCDTRGWIRPGSKTEERRHTRALRLLDHYLPLSGHRSFVPDVRGRGDHPVDVTMSRLLRGYDPRLASLEPLRLARIVSGMERAARRGRVFHLWWHPENFGTYSQQNLELLERVLAAFAVLRRDHGMRSLSMSETRARAEQPERAEVHSRASA